MNSKRNLPLLKQEELWSSPQKLPGYKIQKDHSSSQKNLFSHFFHISSTAQASPK